MKFCNELETRFRKESNRELAVPMENYMKNNFSFLGLKTEKRREIFKLIYEQNKAEIKSNYRTIALELFQMKEREFHQVAIDLLVKEFKKNYVLEDIQLIEKLIIKNSWWDSVDTIAKYILGGYLLQFPSETLKVIERFSNSKNMWLNRSAILFQLSYKEKTNFDLLKEICEKHQDSKEFFIQKAIGWALREYAKTNPEAIRNFVLNSDLKPLSKKEALKNIR